jgi:anti-sigma-K factor RskA
MNPSCSDFTNEDYALWLLGQLERPESSLIREHLDSDCPKCTEGVRQSVGFWSAYGAAASLDSTAKPSPRLRARVLQAIENGPKIVPFWRSKFLYAGAIAACMLLTAAVGWRLGQTREHVPDPTLSRQVADLQGKLSASETEIARLTAQPPTPPVPAAAPTSEKPDRSVELGKALGDANLQIQKLQAALSQEQAQAQAQAARLTQQLDQQTAALAALSRERRDAEGSVVATSARLAERDRQIRTLETKVTQLEQERDSVIEVLSRQKSNIDQNTRLIALLSSPTVKLVRLSGTEAAPKATGYAILVEGRRLIFNGVGLPALPSGKVAQLWLLRGRGPAIVSAGTFQVVGDQTTIEFANPSALTDVRGLAVTEEPRGGSPLPTGHKLLIGTAKS